jgi:MFS family permease
VSGRLDPPERSSRVIRRGTVACLGLSQLISWGISYYLIGLFGDSIASDLRWTSNFVYGGFAWALLVMGLTSPLVGWTIDRRGGRAVMVAGSLLNAVGCAGLAFCTGPKAYYLAWTCIGLGMRLSMTRRSRRWHELAVRRLERPCLRSPS